MAAAAALIGAQLFFGGQPAVMAAELGASLPPVATQSQTVERPKNESSWMNVVFTTPGRLLKATELPLLRNIGTTLESAGKVASAPLTVLEAAVTLDGDKLASAGKDFGTGVLGLVGLERAVLGELKRDVGITGDLPVPPGYAKAILEARKTWWGYSAEEQTRDYSRGMKKWHVLSNARIMANAGLTELPWVLLGGVVHELDPGGMSAEWQGQGVAAWAVDTPGDLVANAIGVVGGLLLPDGTHAELARLAGNLLPGPADHFEDRKKEPATPLAAERSSNISASIDDPTGSD